MPCLFAAFEICHRSHSPLCSLLQIPKPTKIQVKIAQLILSPLLMGEADDDGGQLYASRHHLQTQKYKFSK